MTKTISEKKKCKKENWLSEDVLQTAEKRSEKHRKKGKIYETGCSVPENSKEEREKKSFLNEQYRKVKEKKKKKKKKNGKD